MLARTEPQLLRLARLLAINGAFGAVIGSGSAAGLLLTDVGGLATLFAQSSGDTRAVGAALLFGGFALTFASLAMGSAIMLLPKR